MPSLRSIAASRRSTAAFMPVIKYGECSWARDDERNCDAASAVSIPRKNSSRASVPAASGLLLQAGSNTSSSAKACTRSVWDCLRFQRTRVLSPFYARCREVPRLRSGFRRAAQTPRKRLKLGFVVGPGVVNGEAAEIFGDFHQPLVMVIPLGGRFVEHHHALKSKTELNEAGLAEIGAQPAGIFEIFVASEFRVAQALNHAF